jgi:hypothetical protein
MQARLNIAATLTMAFLPLCGALGQGNGFGAADNAVGQVDPRIESRAFQGLLIMTDDADVEIMINGQSSGKKSLLGIELPVGQYSVEGRKRGHFSDYELEMVEEESTDEITLNLKRVRVQLSPSWGALVDSNTVAGPLVSLEAGLKTVEHHWAAFLVATDGRNYRRENTAFCATGATYNFINFESKYAIVEAGALLGYCWYKRVGGSHDVDVQAYDAPVAGPRLSLQVGLDHFKMIFAAKHFIRLDEDHGLFSLRNPTGVTAGVAFAF